VCGVAVCVVLMDDAAVIDEAHPALHVLAPAAWPA